jgi:hypothetical protein
MEQLSQIIHEATAAIGQEYFLLPIHGAGAPMYRERVYCYELYHQMRLRWPHDSPYLLNGEVDKVRHPYFQGNEGGKPKPDLLVHQPGGGQYNHAVIEIKSVVGTKFRKDLETLSLFRDQLGYERAIFLIYGTTLNNRVTQRVRRCAIKVVRLAAIEVWLHAQPTAPAVLWNTLTPEH